MHLAYYMSQAEEVSVLEKAFRVLFISSNPGWRLMVKVRVLYLVSFEVLQTKDLCKTAQEEGWCHSLIVRFALTASLHYKVAASTRDCL